MAYRKISKQEESTEIDERIERAVQNRIPTIVVSDVSTEPGGKVTVTAKIVNNPGILGMSMTLSYDESVMELINVKNGDAFNDVLTMTNSKSLDSGCIFLWDGEDITSDQVLDGEILVLEFRMSKSAPAGKTPILLTCDKDGVVDKELQMVDIAIENGFITISK